MSAQNDFINILSSTLAVVLAITIIVASNSTTKSSIQNTRADDLNTSDTLSEDEVVSEVKATNADNVDQEQILAKTDFTKKILQFVPGTSEDERNELLASVEAEVLDDLDQNTVVISVPEDNLEETEQQISSSSTVNNLETDYAVGLLARPDWGVERIGASEVWEENTASGVTIAIIDTGVDGEHTELSGKIVAQYDFYNEDAFANDDHGHGTFVAGVASASQNNTGTIGVGHGASLMAAKVLGEDGYGYLSDVVEGVNWAGENGASVINMSLGTTYDSTTLKNAVDRAAANGLVLVAAAGNTGDQMTFPAAYDSVIAIGATDSNDKLASFSARGSELVAPGVDITGPVPGGYVTASGTSASSPHVAGVVAHMIGSQVSDIRGTLRQTAEDLGEEGRDFYFGYGLVDTPAALGMEEDEEELIDLEVNITRPGDGDVLTGRNQVISAVASDEVSEMRLYINDVPVYSSRSNRINWAWTLSDTESGEYSIRVEAETDNEVEAADQISVIVEQVINSNRPATDSARRNNQTDRKSPGQRQSDSPAGNQGGNSPQNDEDDDSSETDASTSTSTGNSQNDRPGNANENAQKNRGVQGQSTESPAIVLLYVVRMLLGF